MEQRLRNRLFLSRSTFGQASLTVTQTSDDAVVPIARTTQHKHTQAGFLTCTLLFDPFPSVEDSGMLPKSFAFEANAAGTHSGATVTDFNRVPFGYTAVKACRTWMAFLIVKEHNGQIIAPGGTVCKKKIILRC